MQIWSNLYRTQWAKIGEKICFNSNGREKGDFSGFMKIFDKLHLFFIFPVYLIYQLW